MAHPKRRKTTAQQQQLVDNQTGWGEELSPEAYANDEYTIVPHMIPKLLQDEAVWRPVKFIPTRHASYSSFAHTTLLAKHTAWLLSITFFLPPSSGPDASTPNTSSGIGGNKLNTSILPWKSMEELGEIRVRHQPLKVKAMISAVLRERTACERARKRAGQPRKFGGKRHLRTHQWLLSLGLEDWNAIIVGLPWRLRHLCRLGYLVKTSERQERVEIVAPFLEGVRPLAQIVDQYVQSGLVDNWIQNTRTTTTDALERLLNDIQPAKDEDKGGEAILCGTPHQYITSTAHKHHLVDASGTAVKGYTYTSLQRDMALAQSQWPEGIYVHDPRPTTRSQVRLDKRCVKLPPDFEDRKFKPDDQRALSAEKESMAAVVALQCGLEDFDPLMIMHNLQVMSVVWPAAHPSLANEAMWRRTLRAWIDRWRSLRYLELVIVDDSTNPPQQIRGRKRKHAEKIQCWKRLVWDCDLNLASNVGRYTFFWC